MGQLLFSTLITNTDTQTATKHQTNLGVVHVHKMLREMNENSVKEHTAKQMNENFST